MLQRLYANGVCFIRMEIVETSVFTDQIKRLVEDDAYKELV